MESLQDEIREIRKELRLAMNGVISTSMREKGICLLYTSDAADD